VGIRFTRTDLVKKLPFIAAVMNPVMNGEILERQRDPVTREWKYVMKGTGLDGTSVGIVGKLSLTGRLVVITVYRV